MPPVPHTPATTIFAHPRGIAPAGLPRSDAIMDTAYFDITVPPSTPLHVGQRVRIKILTVRADERDEAERERRPTPYWASSAGVEGTIIAVRTMELAVAEFVVKNEVAQSLTEHAYLTIPHLEGKTVHMEAWRRVARIFLLPFLLHTRQLEIETNVDIKPRTYSLWRDERPREFSDSEDDLPEYEGPADGE